MIPRRWAVALLASLGVGLLPWALWLGVSLPSQKVAEHWDLTWAGFDVVLGVALLGTAVTLLRGSALLEAFAAATGALLVADAWFDILTAASSNERWFAVGLGIVGELPLATLCFVLARPRTAR